MAEGQPAYEDFTLWVTTAVLAMTALALSVIIIFRLALHRVHQEKEKRRQAELQHQQKLLYNSIHTQERERERIAGDLHDELSSRLHVLKLSLYNTKSSPDENNKLLDEAIGLSRRIAHDLYPPLLKELGLIEALQDFLQPLEQKLSITFFAIGNTENLTAKQTLHLFRISQELVQNAIKHAEPSKLSLSLKVAGTYIALQVYDNGKGFSPSQVKTGLGLNNVEARVQLLGGIYKIKTVLGKGTRVIVLITKKEAKG